MLDKKNKLTRVAHSDILVAQFWAKIRPSLASARGTLKSVLLPYGVVGKLTIKMRAKSPCLIIRPYCLNVLKKYRDLVVIMLYYSHVHIYHAIGSGPLRQGADKIYSPRGRHFRHIPTTSRCGARQPGPHSHAVRPTRHLTRRRGARVWTSRPLWPSRHQVQRPGELLVYKLFYFNTVIKPIKLKLFILIHFSHCENTPLSAIITCTA